MTLLIYEFGEKKEEKSPLALATPATIAMMILDLIASSILAIALSTNGKGFSSIEFCQLGSI
jgi:hypothetical protein